jgi:hypothetical protein
MVLPNHIPQSTRAQAVCEGSLATISKTIRLCIEQVVHKRTLVALRKGEKHVLALTFAGQ